MTDSVVRAFITAKEMLSDRGIDTSRLDSFSEVEIDKMSKTNAIFSFTVSESLILMFYMNSKFKINDMRRYLKLDNTRYIIIFKERINNLNMRNLKEHMPGVEIFSLSEMMFNVSRHAYVPKHEIVSDPEEVAAVMTNYNIKQMAQFPVILRTDAMSKYLDIKIGDLVRITRPSVSAGESIVYRICA